MYDFFNNFKFVSVKCFCIAIVLLGSSFATHATEHTITGLSIRMMRSVGDYSGTTYDNTMEIWLTTPITWPAGSKCLDTTRVVIDAKNKHLIATAMMAFAMNKTININVDDTLPMRGVACEVSFVDIY